MRKVLKAATLLTFWMLVGADSVMVKAQTPAACGCAFVAHQQPENVRVTFKGELQAIPVTAGTVVHVGDLLKVRSPVSGTLICDNVIARVALISNPRNQPVPCNSTPEEGILIGRNGRKIDGPTMGDTASFAFPIVLTPRSTNTLEKRPILRWTSIPNAKTYKVTVRGEQESWSLNIDAVSGKPFQEITYPESCGSERSTWCAPSLKNGETYKVIVEANGRSSEEENLPNMGFTLLEPEKAQRIQAIKLNISELDVDADLRTKMLASLYANNRLNADAIQLLENDKAAQENPESIRLLGSLYLRVGLIRRAETLYLRLLEPTMLSRDTRIGQAISEQTLGEIYEGVGNKPEAIKHYVQAKSIFQFARESASLNAVESRLTALGAP
jgi:hypothetical protein